MKIKSLSDLPPVLTVRQLQVVLQVGRNQAYRLVKEKKVPVFYLGRSPRIPKDELIKQIYNSTEGRCS